MKEKGQVVLVVMLVSALVLTLGLSTARQTTVETKINTDEEMLKESFNMAESGVEYYLGTGNKSFSASSNSGANLSVNEIGGAGVRSLDSGGQVQDGDSALFWLMAHTNDGALDKTSYYGGGTIDICSQSNSTNVKVDYFYWTGTSYQVRRVYQTTSGIGNCITAFSLSGGSPVLVAVTPIGSSTIITINGSADFPIQGEEISSTGNVDEVSSTVKVLNKYDVPGFMLEAITAGGDVTIN